MIDQALEVVDRNRDLPPEQQFVWTIPGWPMHKILEDWPGQTPERKRGVEQALPGRPVRGPRPAVHHAYRAAGARRPRPRAGLFVAARTRRLGLRAAPRRQDDRRAGTHLDDAHPAEARRRRVHAHRLQRHAAPAGRAAAFLVGRAGRLAAADRCIRRDYGTRSGAAAGLALPDLAGPASTPATTTARRGPRRSRRLLDQAARRAARREGPDRPALRLRRRHPAPRNPTCPWSAATRPTPGFTGRCPIRRARSSPATTRPAHRRHRGAQHAASRLGRAPCPMPPRPSPRPTSRACSTASTPGAARSAGSTTGSASATAFQQDRAAGRFEHRKPPGRSIRTTSPRPRT